MTDDSTPDGLPFHEDADTVHQAILAMGAEPELQVAVVEVFFEELDAWERHLLGTPSAMRDGHDVSIREQLVACLHEVAGGLAMAGAGHSARGVRQIEWALRDGDMIDPQDAARRAHACLQAGSAALGAWLARARRGAGPA